MTDRKHSDGVRVHFFTNFLSFIVVQKGRSDTFVAVQIRTARCWEGVLKVEVDLLPNL